MSGSDKPGSPAIGEGQSADGQARLRVGLTLIYSADTRLLDATLKCLGTCGGEFDRAIILERSAIRRALRHVDPPFGFERLETPVGRSAHQFAIDTLDDCDLVIFLSEGIVLGPDAIAAERRRFEADPSIAAAQVVSDRTLDLSAYLSGEDRDDPFGALRRGGRSTGVAGARYFTPCIFTVAPRRGGEGRFENFARRSEWAVYRHFASRCSGRCIDEKSDAFGAIVNLPDRRDSRGQGFEICEELNRFAVAFPEYEADMARDRRRLMISQLLAILKVREARAHWRFFLGCLDSMRRGRALRTKLNRDIRNLG